MLRQLNTQVGIANEPISNAPKCIDVWSVNSVNYPPFGSSYIVTNIYRKPCKIFYNCSSSETWDCVSKI